MKENYIVATLRLLENVYLYPEVPFLEEDLDVLVKIPHTSKTLSLTLLSLLSSTLRIKHAPSPRKLWRLLLIHLTSLSPHVRRAAVGLVGVLGGGDKGKEEGVEGVLEGWCRDGDAGVRGSSLQTLLELHSTSHLLPITLYASATQMLKDDDEGVRVGALLIIWALTKSNPTARLPSTQTPPQTRHASPVPSVTGKRGRSPVGKGVSPSVNIKKEGAKEVGKEGGAGKGGEGVKMVDDAFMKMCDCVGDGSVGVRAQALTLLGTLPTVHPTFLMQTLSKELLIDTSMPDVGWGRGRGRGGRGRGRGRGRGGAGSSGDGGGGRVLGVGKVIEQTKYKSKYVTETKDLNLESEEYMSLLDASACGAFIHGLEDEFERVRLCTVSSICALALKNEDFALQSLDMLIDMFNDEFPTLRLTSLHALQQICAKYTVVVREERLENLSMVFFDRSGVVRSNAYHLVGLINLPTAPLLLSLHTTLKSNLTRFPGDVDSVYDCIACVGVRNCGVVCERGVVEGLLGVDGRFLAREGGVGDLGHIANLCLILSAIHAHPDVPRRREMVSWLPEYVKWQALYLRGRVGGLRGVEKLFEEEDTNGESEMGAGDRRASRVSLHSVSDMEMDVDTPSYESVKPVSTDLETTYITHLTTGINGALSLASLSSPQSLVDAVGCLEVWIGDVNNLTKGEGRKGFKRMDEARFLGDFGELLSCILKIKSLPPSPHSLTTLDRLLERSMCLTYRIEAYIGGGTAVRNILEGVREFVRSGWDLVRGCRSPDDVAEHFQKIRTYEVPHVPTVPVVRFARGRVLVSGKEGDGGVMGVMRGFERVLGVDGEVVGVDLDGCGVCVLLTYPDGSIHPIRPPFEDFTKIGPMKYTLKTEIRIRGIACSEQYAVQISLATSHAIRNERDVDILRNVGSVVGRFGEGDGGRRYVFVPVLGESDGVVVGVFEEVGR
ncbi:Integrator complex subunit 4 [Rhizophlyctis rosea]|nr:Integrator complex subunit 4 [Rhizophlyctis rosea]